VLLGKDTRLERRRFNDRTMIWALQHHMPDQYLGGEALKRPAVGEETISPATIAEARETIIRRIEAIKAQRVRLAAADSGAAALGDAAAED
jgi:hypothetical protein